MLPRTLEELAREALDVQNASNPNGLDLGFCEASRDLSEIMPTIDSVSFARHPIIRMWVSKLHDMAGMGPSDERRFSEAYTWCCQHSKPREEVEAHA